MHVAKLYPEDDKLLVIRTDLNWVLRWKEEQGSEILREITDLEVSRAT